MRSVPAALFAALLITGFAHAAVETRSGGTPGSLAPPHITVLSSDARGVDLIFELPVLSVEDMTAGGRVFRTVAIPGGDLEGEIGSPAIPVFTRFLAIPNDAAVTVSATREEVQDLSGPPLAPMQTSDGDGFAWNADAYAVDAYDDAPAIRSGRPGIMRDLRLVALTFRPVQYNPARAVMKVCGRIHVRVDFTGQDLENARVPRVRPMAPSFDRIYRSIVVNYDGPPAGVPALPGTYLIITPNDNNVLSRLQPLVDWRKRKGTPVYVATYAETGNTKESIKAFIQNAYDTWTTPPEFVCLVGDASQSNILCPTWHESLSGYYGEGDHPYTQLEGGDILPDLNIGRLSVYDMNELQLVVQKIVGYESTPDLSDPGWFQRACLIGDPYDSGYSTVMAQQWIKHRLRSLGWTDVDTIFTSPFVSRIATAMNRGDVIMSYRGIQGMSGWRNTNTYSLTNGWKMPFCVVITCDTGSFETDQACRSEAFLRAGSIDNPKAGIGAIGTSTIGTHTRFNNCIHYGIFYGLLYEGDFTMGEALTRGKLELYLNYQETDPNRVAIWSTWNNLMGDPALECWTGYPQPLTVECPSSVPVGTNAITVHVSDAGGAVEGALVCLWKGSETYAVAATDAQGSVELPVAASTAGLMQLTVSKHDRYTQQGTVSVVAQDRFVAFHAATIDDDGAGASQGNADGAMNPGEVIEVGVQVLNYGTQSAAGVTGTVTSDDPYVTILQSGQTFGDIPAGGVAWSSETCVVAISSSCPDRRRIRFGLDLTSGADHWHSLIEVPITSSDLVATGYTLYNAGGNSLLDPGETVQLSIGIANQGSADAVLPTASIFSESPFLDIVDRSGAYGTIPMGGSGENIGDTFAIHAATNAYRGGLATLRVVLAFSGGATDTTRIEIPIGTRTATDPTGPDPYGYYAFDSSDLFYHEHPVFRWIELDPTYGGSGATEIVLGDLGDYQDKSVPVDIPFPFQYYGRTYDRATVCSNGWLAMGSQTNCEYRNWTIPGAGGPEAMIAPFWDDLNQYGGGKCFQRYDPVDHVWIIEWSHFRNSYNGAQETFEVILRDPSQFVTDTGDGEILFQYLSVNNGDNIDGNGTVGIENETQSVGLLYTFFNRYTPGSAPLAASRAILFTPRRQEIAAAGDATAGPHAFGLDRNLPNPFHPTTTIRFSLAQEGQARLAVFDVAGRRVRTLVDGMRSAGSHAATWDGRNEAGRPCPSGVYLYRLDAGDRSDTRKMLLVQ